MIAQITGKLVELSNATAVVQIGQLCYEVLLPGYLVSALSNKINQEITLCTMEYYEGAVSGGNLIPRIVGFLDAGEKRFFARYTSVKGIGIRKGLKSLTIPIAAIASAIENGDEKILLSLPSVGKRLAQHIIAELRGKLGDFAVQTVSNAQRKDVFSGFQIEAMEILIAWGEKRNEIMELIQMASKKHPEIKSAEELVPLVYRIKQGIEV